MIGNGVLVRGFAGPCRWDHYNRYSRFPRTEPVNTQRFEHCIAGRNYVIEVLPVTATRWRAQIARLPGGRAALMPFYGTTAQEAATQLSGWLTRASRAQ